MVLGSLCMLSKREQAALKLDLHRQRQKSRVADAAGLARRARRRAALKQARALKKTENTARAMGLGTDEVLWLRRLFDKADEDGGGEIDIDELVVLCKQVRGGQLAHLSKWDLVQYMHENDNDNSGTMDFDEFLELVSPRKEAFRNQQAEKTQRRIAKANQTWTRVRESRNRYAWKLYGDYQNRVQRFGRKMGYSEKSLQQHLQRYEEVDADGSGELDVDELMVLMRTLGRDSRDNMSREDVMRMMKPFDWRRVGRIDVMGFLEMMSPRRARAKANQARVHDSKLRSIRKQKMLNEAAPGRRRDLASRHEDAALKRWTRKLGYTDGDVETVRKQFNACDTDGSGEIDLDELCRMLRLNKSVVPAHLKRASRDEVAKLLDEYDNDHSATIDFREFLHMISPRREKFHLQEARRAAARRAKADNKAAGFDNARYRAAMSRWNTHLNRLWRHGRNMGFSDREIDELKVEFDRYDADGSGDIDLRELTQIVRNKMNRHDLSQEELKVMMHEFDYKRSGTITFAGFLEMFSKRRQRAKDRFMAQLTETRERARVTAGLDGGASIIYKSGLTPVAPRSPRLAGMMGRVGRGGRTPRAARLQFGGGGKSHGPDGHDPLLDSWIEESRGASPRGKPPKKVTLPGL